MGSFLFSAQVWKKKFYIITFVRGNGVQSLLSLLLAQRKLFGKKMQSVSTIRMGFWSVYTESVGCYQYKVISYKSTALYSNFKGEKLLLKKNDFKIICKINYSTPFPILLFAVITPIT